MEIINIPEEVRAAMYKVASINLCSNVNGQICTAMVMNPPKVSHPYNSVTQIMLPMLRSAVMVVTLPQWLVIMQGSCRRYCLVTW